jgi:hypothetical protein
MALLHEGILENAVGHSGRFGQTTLSIHLLYVWKHVFMGQ